MRELNNTDQFLDLYKRLETVGRMKFFPKSAGDENIIGRLINHEKFKRYREELNYCRVVRNFLTHNPKVGGEFPIVPSEAMINLLQKMLEFIDSPPLAISHAIKRKNLFTAELSDRVLEVSRIMAANAYSHIPVIKKSALFGVFSDNTVYEYLAQEGALTITSETTMDYFRDYIPLGNHANELFLFVAETATVSEVEDLFENDYHNNKRLRVVFLTKNGRANESILGMMTPRELIINN